MRPRNAQGNKLRNIHEYYRFKESFISLLAHLRHVHQYSDVEKAKDTLFIRRLRPDMFRLCKMLWNRNKCGKAKVES